MEKIQEWTDFYQKMDIEVRAEKNVKSTWLYAIIGKNDIRALLFHIENKSYSYRKELLKKVLELLQLAETYPWVIITKQKLYIIFRCQFSGKVFNDPPLLWNTEIVINSSTHDIVFHSGFIPVYKPSYVDFDVLVNCLESYKNIIRVYEEYCECELVEDLYTGTFEETWSLKNFMSKFGPKLQLGGYPKVRGHGEFWPVCRFGDSSKGWKYAYISLRMREISARAIKENAKNLRIGKLPNSKYYMMYDNSPKKWEDIEINFPVEDVDSVDKGDYLPNEYGTPNEFAGSYAQDVMGYSDEEINDAFDGDPDAYWNID